MTFIHVDANEHAFNYLWLRYLHKTLHKTLRDPQRFDKVRSPNICLYVWVITHAVNQAVRGKRGNVNKQWG